MPPIAIAAGVIAAGSIGSAAIGAHAAGSAADAQAAAAEKQAQLYEPFRQAGVSALPSLQEGVAPGGDLIAPFTQEFKAPTVTDDPGYKFRLDQGMKALQGSAAARGNLLTGGTAKAMTDYAQGSASQEYGNAYNRALSEYDIQRSNFYTNQANEYNRLMGVADVGLKGTMGAADAAGAAGAAQASGAVGAGNAWAGGVSGATGALGNYLLLSQLLK